MAEPKRAIPTYHKLASNTQQKTSSRPLRPVKHSQKIRNQVIKNRAVLSLIRILRRLPLARPRRRSEAQVRPRKQNINHLKYPPLRQKEHNRLRSLSRRLQGRTIQPYFLQAPISTPRLSRSEQRKDPHPYHYHQETAPAPPNWLGSP